VAALLAALPPTLAPDVGRLGLVGALRRVVDDLGRELDGVTWQIDPAGERASAELSPLAAEVLFGAAREAIRNAARHARPDDQSRPLHLAIDITAEGEHLIVRVDDDGIGLAGRASSTTHDGLGGGQGLILHGTLLTVLGGSLAIDGRDTQGTRVTLCVPAATPPLASE
jgi:signal transduction histidine kinase